MLIIVFNKLLKIKMTGIEALVLLKNGHILRRKAWDSDERCKAYFSDHLWSIRLECYDANELTLAPEHVPDKPEFAHYMSVFDAIDGGEFLEDDWEIVE